MFTRFHRNLVFALFTTVIVLVSSFASAQDQPRRGRKYVPPPETAKIEVTVLRASSGRPITNAAVIFHPMKGEKDKGAMELKTNDEGKAVIDVIPIGDTVRLQIIAPGFRTYGEDYKIESAERAITVKMVKPTEQYSIYKTNPEDAEKPASSAEASPAGPGTATKETAPKETAPKDNPPKN